MTAALPPRADVRDCRLYRFFGWDPATSYSTKRLIYVGETVRQPIERLMEHIDEQPWADTITSWEVDDRVWAGKDAVLEAERRAIESEQPLYNVEHNRLNPRRIPSPIAIRQRRARDASRNRPRWVHPDDRPVRRGSTSASVPARAVGPRSWRPWQRKVALFVSSGSAATGVVWASLARLGWLPSTQAEAVTAAVLTVTALAGALWYTPRRWRRLRRWLR